MMRINWLQDPIEKGLAASGVDLGNFKILLCALLSFPFSAIFKRLPDHNYTLKNVYVVAVSSFYIFGILELYLGVFSLLVASMGTYFITRYLRNNYMPWINLIFLMSYLSYFHLHEQFFQQYDPAKIDITGALMVMVMKLSSFGWSVHDGKQSKESLTAYTRSRVVKKHPNLLPYLGYSFFYASLLTGPAFDYSDYDLFIHGTLFEDVPESRRPGRRRKRVIPRSGRVALKKTLQGFGWAFIFVQLPRFIDPDYMFDPEFVSRSFFYRLYYLWGVSFFLRLKYYTIWTISEAGCILCGLGYNGYDSVTDSFKWDRVQNIDPYGFETGQNVHACLEAWNMNTNKWLKNFVYLRLAREGKKPGFKSTLMTFLTSAFWHGFRPGYYMTFATGAFLQTVGKIFRRNFRPIFVDKDGNKSLYKPVYDVISYIITQLAFAFVTQPFGILEFQKSVYCWSTVHFYIIWGIFITLGIFRGPYKKEVSQWCQLYHMTTGKIERKPKFNRTESEKVTKALNHYLKDRDLIDSPALGVPSLDELEQLDGKEIGEEWKDLVDAWNTFKAREDDFGVKAAYNNFKSEIEEILDHKKIQASEVKSTTVKKANEKIDSVKQD